MYGGKSRSPSFQFWYQTLTNAIGAEHQEPEEVRAKEIAGAETILSFVGIGAILYFCMSFIPSFPSTTRSLTNFPYSAPYAINFVSGMISKNWVLVYVYDISIINDEWGSNWVMVVGYSTNILRIPKDCVIWETTKKELLAVWFLKTYVSQNSRGLLVTSLHYRLCFTLAHYELLWLWTLLIILNNFDHYKIFWLSWDLLIIIKSPDYHGLL